LAIAPQQATLASNALASQYREADNKQQIKDLLATGQWILKTQNEGGGNVFDEHSNLAEIDTEKEHYLLMEKINVQPRQDAVDTLNKQQLVQQDAVISELGIFTVGDDHDYGGYLLRSKAETVLEAGVHKGWGFLDSVALN